MATTTAANKTLAKKTLKSAPQPANGDTTPAIVKAVTVQKKPKKNIKPSKTTQTPAVADKSPITTKASEARKPAGQDKSAKIKKPKLVRDSFTIPKDEYLVIDSLKQRSAKLGQPMKKSELLRAGIKLLNSLEDAAFKQAIAQVPAIKTGRPKTAK